MAIEIERKFLVTGDNWRSLAEGVRMRQGYLPTDDSCVVRVRTTGSRAWLTIKGRTEGIARQEFEYSIPVSDAAMLLDRFCRSPLVDKIRYTIHYGGFVWEVDEFFGDNRGLILAEVELSAENEQLALPDWIDREVSDDPRYFNVNLARHPYCCWDGEQE